MNLCRADVVVLGGENRINLPSNFHDQNIATTIRNKMRTLTRVLRVVERRIRDRASALSLLSPTMSSPADIPRLRLLRETEPLQAAWDRWKELNDVRFSSSLSPY